MTTVHLSEDLERFLSDAVKSGRYASTDSVIRDALGRLREAVALPESATESQRDSSPAEKTLTKQEFHRHLKQIGLLDDPSAADAPLEGSGQTAADDDPEILSDVMIRERLIEWLTGFLGK